MSPDEVLLPQTEGELDTLVAEITEQFKLPDDDRTYEAIATMILHLPSDRAYATRAYFGNAVRKMIANSVAFEKCEEFRAKRNALEKAKASPEGTPSREQPV